MSLSKQQMIGAVGAGIFVVCAGGLGWMLYSAWSDTGLCFFLNFVQYYLFSLNFFLY